MQQQPKTGVVRRWFSQKGYGFIAPDDERDDDLFCHIRDVVGFPDRLHEGQRVSFFEGPNARTGKVQAQKVQVT